VEFKAPLLDIVQNLRKENEGFSREIERYEALYRQMLTDYMKTIEEHKKVRDETVKEHTLMMMQSARNGKRHSVHETRLCSVPESPQADNLQARQVDIKKRLNSSFKD